MDSVLLGSLWKRCKRSGRNIRTFGDLFVYKQVILERKLVKSSSLVTIKKNTTLVEIKKKRYIEKLQVLRSYGCGSRGTPEAVPIEKSL